MGRLNASCSDARGPKGSFMLLGEKGRGLDPCSCAPGVGSLYLGGGGADNII